MNSVDIIIIKSLEKVYLSINNKTVDSKDLYKYIYEIFFDEVSFIESPHQPMVTFTMNFIIRD